jgi:hypothetical protein
MTDLWTPEMDMALFLAMDKLRPVGLNKHFHMLNIASKFNQQQQEHVTIAELWKRITTLWDVSVLDELVLHLWSEGYWLMISGRMNQNPVAQMKNAI